MNQKTKTASRALQNRREAPTKSGGVAKTPGYQLCKAIVMDVAGGTVADVVERYEREQRERLEAEVLGLLDRGNGSMLSFDGLRHVDFNTATLVTTSFEELEPLTLDPDNYNRKTLERTGRVPPPKSATELWNRNMAKVKSASVLSRLPRKSVKQACKPRDYLQLDFNKTNLKRVNSTDQQLRIEMANSKQKAKKPRQVIKVR